MTKTHVAKQLLRLGPLTLVEFASITGWGYKKSRSWLSYLKETGQIVWSDGKWKLKED